VGAALVSTFATDLKELESSKLRKSSELRRAQHDAAAKLVWLKHDREVQWRWAFLLRAGAITGGLATLIGLFALLLASRRRRWFAGFAGFTLAACVAIVTLLYHVLPALAAGAGVVFGLIVVAIAAGSK
jgi:hypothetical protein